MKICNNHHSSKEELGGLGHIPIKFCILGQRKTQCYKKPRISETQEKIGAWAQIIKLDGITYNIAILKTEI